MKGQTTYLTNPEEPGEEPKKFTFDYSYWSHDGFEEKPNGYLGATNPKYADQVLQKTIILLEVWSYEKTDGVILSRMEAGYSFLTSRLGNHDLWKSESFLKLWECQLPWPHAYACHTASFTMTFPCGARTDLWQGVLWPHPFFKRIFPFNSVFGVLVCYWCGSSFQLLFVEKASLKVWSFFPHTKL